ncbi:hypothetical protein E4U41_004670 [Claviceps citrina]|nr:hypothetical protein E4U41_004670 [Claviceps citrina]
MERETLDQMQARHRRELKDLQGRITNKKKNATKKTRRGVNDECAEMERVLREAQAGEVAALRGCEGEGEGEGEGDSDGTGSGHARLLRAAEEQGADEGPARDMAGDGQGQQQQQQQQQEQQRPPPPPTTQQQVPPPPPARKRNRQKDRLARRAAEQAAVAQSAQAEASTMTDHRARERTSLQKTFEAHGLVEREIAPDGHCLFSAVADQLVANGVPVVGGDDDENGGGGGSPDLPPYRIVRRAAAAYMVENRDRFEGFVEGGDLAAHAGRIRDTAEWGGQLELMALAGRYGVEVRVVQDGGRVERIGGEERGREKGEAEAEGEGEGVKVLWLAYYRFGYGLGEHYNSLRKGG